LRSWVCIHVNQFERVLGDDGKLCRNKLRSGLRVHRGRRATCAVHLQCWIRIYFQHDRGVRRNRGVLCALQRRKFVRRLQMAASTVHVCSGFGGDSDRSNFVLVFHGRLRIRECVSWGSRTARRVLLCRRLRVDVKHLDCVFRDHRVVRCVRPWSRVCWGHCTASGVFLLSRLRFRRNRDSIMFGKWRHMHRMWRWLRVRWRQRAARGLLVCARSGFNINNIKFVHWHYGHLLNRRLRLRKRVYGGRRAARGLQLRSGVCLL
jgi:hypothetical protein